MEKTIVKKTEEKVVVMVRSNRTKNLPSYPTKCDAHIVDVYKWTYDENHKIVKKLVDKKDIFKYIQSFKDSTGVYNVLRLLQARGESLERLDASKGSGFYGDISEMPEDPHAIHQLGEDSKAILKQYNDALGTEYSIDGFLKALADGTLSKLIAENTTSPKGDEKKVGEQK